MDFPSIAKILIDNPIIGIVAVIVLLAITVSGMGKSGSVNLTNALAFAGTQSSELIKKTDLALDLSKSNSTLLVENTQLRFENSDLKKRVGELEAEVLKVKKHASDQDEFLNLRIRELQASHDAIQFELNQKNTLITELQMRLDKIQLELDEMKIVKIDMSKENNEGDIVL